jgi:ribosomal protein L40E
LPRTPTTYVCMECGEEKTVRNPNKTKTCRSCFALRNIQTMRESGIFPKRLRPYESHYKTLIYEAQRGGHKNELSFEDFLEFIQIKSCHYCDKEIPWIEYAERKHSRPGYFLDRKDNLNGYTKNNVVVCCSKCNQIKSNEFTYDEFIRLIKFIIEMRFTHSLE